MLLKITKRSQKTPYKHKNRHLRLRFGLLVLCALFYNVNASTADTAVNLSEFCLNFRSNTSKLMQDNGTEDFVKSIEINENWRFVSQNENQKNIKDLPNIYHQRLNYYRERILHTKKENLPLSKTIYNHQKFSEYIIMTLLDT